jgi:carboxymethylenebutenolidase
MTATISIETLEGGDNFAAYIAEPAGTATAAIVVIQEIFGVNAGIRRKCDQLAEAGYLAIAPDLFWRLAPGIELDPDIPDQFKAALDYMGKFNQDQGIRDIEATIHTARERVGGGKVGAVGYCLGGRLAFMTASRTDIDASVGYYGSGSMACCAKSMRSRGR